MKIIDLLVKKAKGEEIPKKIRYGSYIMIYDIDENDYRTPEQDYYDCDVKTYKWLFTDCIDIFADLNDEIEIIEEETTYEQNFTGWKIIQNGKVMASYGYNEPALKPANVVDVEKDVKEMLEEKPKKIEEVVSIELLGQCDNWLQHSGTEEKSCMELNPYILETITRNFRLLYHKQCELTKAVNYLLEKESDK